MHCNLKCPSCPTGIGILARERGLLDVDHFKAIVDALGKYVFVIEFYNWGEPLLHKRFPEMVRYATERGIRCYASSNLSMPLTAQKAREIVTSGLHSLKVGVDGATPETHARYRRGSNLNVVHENLRKLVATKAELKSKYPKLSPTFHVFEHNEHEIDEVRAQMRSLGIKNLGVLPAILPPNGEVRAPKDKFYDLYARINRIREKMRRHPSKIPACSWLYFTSTINPNLSVSPCCASLNEVLDFGRVDERNVAHSFSRVWNSDHYRGARAIFANRRSLAAWATETCQDATPDGMAFSQLLSETPKFICDACPIPETVVRWNSLFGQLTKEHELEKRRLLEGRHYASAALMWVKISLLRLAGIIATVRGDLILEKTADMMRRKRDLSNEARYASISGIQA